MVISFCSCLLKSRFNRAGRKNKVAKAACRQKNIENKQKHSSKPDTEAENSNCRM